MAIPKVIHYCWLSDDPYPELVERCIRSWHEKLTGYEFVLWNKAMVSKEIQSTWIDSALAVKKWAFAADYIRLYALYNYGGIYLDTDVEVVRSFDELLPRKFFLGRESHKNVIEAAVMGAEKQQEWLGNALKWYENRIFDIASLNDPSIAIPVVLKNALAYYDGMEIFPSDYFSPKDNRTGKFSPSKDTYTIHHFNGAWFSPYQKEYFRIRVKYSQKYGVFVGFMVATLFSIKSKFTKGK